ncbi:MAG: histidine--tRNA ligase [Calditrichia bacterium]
MSKNIKPRLYKGTRDFLPEQMIKRNFVIDIIKNIFEKFGFDPLETPAMELWETLSGKYGEEGDRLTYRFIDRGKREVGLRYDLTVPLSRVIALYPEISKPFKRYQIQPVWRADKPQKGRFREFYQCDIDIVGSTSMLSDAEIISALYHVLRDLKFKKFTIRINSRKILSGITEISGASLEKEAEVARSIDKFDKIGLKGVREELISRGIESRGADKILQVLGIEGSNKDRLRKLTDLLKTSKTGLAGIKEIEDLLNYLKMLEVPEQQILFDLYLARGLDYYTGPIYETVVDEPRIGSITGGGRYDNLIGLFSGQNQPATGSSIGLERIITVMDELKMFPDDLKTSVEVLITIFDTSCLPYSIKIANLLRQENINCDLYSGESKLRGQFGLANDRNIPIAVVAGPDEIKINTVNIKNMRTGKQVNVPLENMVNEIRQQLRIK